MHHLSSGASCYGRLVPGAQASGSARPMDSINSRSPGSLSVSRGSTHSLASASGRELARRRGRSRTQVDAALFEPPPFQPAKLSVQYLPGSAVSSTHSISGSCNSCTMPLPRCRRYTLTHNDITGALQLSIGSDYNQQQVQGFYTRILRDEITAEWLFCRGGPAPAELHIYCHVSGEERWLAPPQLRNYIFRREMTLVLDTFVYADQQLLQVFPDLLRSKVYVHFQSDVQDLDLREYWGVLGDRATWRRMPKGVLARLKLLLFGFPAVPHQRPRHALTHQQQQHQQQQQGLLVPAAATAAASAAGSTTAGVQAAPATTAPAAVAAAPEVATSSSSSSSSSSVHHQWQPQAELAVEATRPVALSLQAQRQVQSQLQADTQQQQQHEQEQQQQHDLEQFHFEPPLQQQQQPVGLDVGSGQGEACSCCGCSSGQHSSSSSSSCVAPPDEQQQQQQRQQQQAQGELLSQQQQQQQAQVTFASGLLSVRDAEQQQQQWQLPPQQVLQEQLEQAAVIDALTEYGRWRVQGTDPATTSSRPRTRQLVQAAANRSSSSSSAGVGGGVGGTMLSTAMLGGPAALQLALQQQQEQMLLKTASCAAVVMVTANAVVDAGTGSAGRCQ